MGTRTASAAIAVLGLMASGCVSTDGPPIPPAGFTSTTSPGGDPVVTMPVATETASRTVASGAAAAGTAAAFPASAPAVGRQVLAPPASQPSTTYQAAAAEPVGTPSAAAPLPLQPAQQPVASIRFTPVIGAPIDVVRPLSSELTAAAQRRGVAIRTSSDVSSDNILRGYFSALNDGRETTVVYVWDVLDNAGNRLHRIQGKETIPGKPGDPWASVPASTMQAIANRTIDAYLEWHNSASS